jgi:hypothetical protein
LTRTVYVLGTPQEINVQRKWKTVWIASGDYAGKRIEVKGRTEEEVVAAWQRAAQRAVTRPS